MTTKSLGQMANAPLAYVIAAINFDRQMALDDYIPMLQEKLQGAGYSRYKPTSETVLQVNPGNTVQQIIVNRHEFSDRDNSCGVMLNNETLAFHATSYSNYDDFAKRLITVLEIVATELNYLFVRRIGLRYVDVIVPYQDESPDVYIDSNLRCLPQLSLTGKANSGIAVGEFQMEQGSLVIRYSVGSIQQALPMDLNILSLTHSSVLQQAQNHSGMTATLDIDRYLPYENEFNSNEVMTVLNTLHSDQSQAFHELSSEHARRVWSTSTESV